MTTTFYTTWQIKKRNGVKVWYDSPEFQTEAEARAIYEAKMQDARVVEARLCKHDFYRPDELRPRAAKNHPCGLNDFTRLSSYSRI